MLSGKDCNMPSEPTPSPPIKSYRDLRVWQRATDLIENLYRATATFPVTERYGLVAQLRRAGVSVASNIAEGHTRSRADYRRFLVIAAGSRSEEHTSELQSPCNLVCRPLLEKKIATSRLSPADGPSFGCTPAGTLTWMSFLSKSARSMPTSRDRALTNDSTAAADSFINPASCLTFRHGCAICTYSAAV